MKIFENGKMRDATQEEIAQLSQDNFFTGLTESEIAKALLAERYNIEDRIELLFNMFTNPTSAKEYLEFVKECKERAKELFKGGNK